MPTYASPIDRYLAASEAAKETAEGHAARLQRMTGGDKLTQAQQQAMYDKHYRPLIAQGKVADALRLVARQMPAGSDPRHELERLVTRFGKPTR